MRRLRNDKLNSNTHDWQKESQKVSRVARALTLTLLANNTFSNRVTQSVSLAVDASFQFVDAQS